VGWSKSMKVLRIKHSMPTAIWVEYFFQ